MRPGKGESDAAVPQSSAPKRLKATPRGHRRPTASVSEGWALEHFPAKWAPVRVEKMRQIEKLELLPDLETGNALAETGIKPMKIFSLTLANVEPANNNYADLI
ncbi:MAG TPA: hypothetical protein VME69_03975 [Methylocella sp.]|nr:hypothetical protein [Methylocella sp.]